MKKQIQTILRFSITATSAAFLLLPVASFAAKKICSPIRICFKDERGNESCDTVYHCITTTDSGVDVETWEKRGAAGDPANDPNATFENTKACYCGDCTDLEDKDMTLCTKRTCKCSGEPGPIKAFALPSKN